MKAGEHALEIELYLEERHSGLMLLHSDERILGQVTGNKINFEFQDLVAEGKVFGTASLDDSLLTMELYFFNPTTSLAMEARGTFTRH